MYNRFKRHRLKIKIMESSPLKIIVGSGGTNYAGWLPTDYPVFDVANESHWEYLFSKNPPVAILAEHVFEHITTEQFKEFLRLANLYLTKKAIVRIAVPDGYHPSKDYIEMVRPGGYGAGSEDHKVLYDCDTLAGLLKDEGVSYRLVEYFDSDRNFNSEYSDTNGFISRSYRNDRRNTIGQPPVYTSLIVDLYFN